MQEAQASALKEKFEKRQKILRKNGHDTSRLEQHHKIELMCVTSKLANILIACNIIFLDCMTYFNYSLNSLTNVFCL